LGFEGLQLVQEGIELRVRDLRVVMDVVTLFVVADLRPKGVDTGGRLVHGWGQVSQPPAAVPGLELQPAAESPDPYLSRASTKSARPSKASRSRLPVNRRSCARACSANSSARRTTCGMMSYSCSRLTSCRQASSATSSPRATCSISG